jgi:hypothetical protein
MLENTEKAIKYGQSRETGNTGHVRRRPKIQKNKKNTTQHRYQGLAFLDLLLTSIPLVSVLKTFLFTTVYECD